MADFAAILRKNIEKLGDTTPDVRERIYGKAREALERKIAAIDPPPAQAVVDRQFEKLAEAVAEVEAEYAPPATLEDQLDDLDSLLSGESELGAPQETDIAEEMPEPTSDEPEPLVSEPPSQAVPPEEVIEPVSEVSSTAEIEEEDPLRTFLEENVETFSMPEAKSLEVPQPADAGYTRIDEPPAAGEPAPYVSDTPILEPKKPGPAWGRLGILVICLAILGGGGYFASTLPQVQSVLGLNADDAGDGETDLPVREVTTTTVDAGENAPDSGTLQDGEVDITVEGEGSETVVVGTNPETTPKFTQRLTEDGIEIDDGPAPGATEVGEGTSVSDLTPGSETEEPAVTEGGNTIEGGTAEDGDTAEQTPTETQTPLRIGQRAIFYEERTGTEAGTAVPGAIIWTQVQESPGGDLPLEPAIRGEVNIPDLDLSLIMTIRRNGDQTLPASHFIELSFDVPETFTGRGVADVQRVTFKGSEEDPGTALIGVFVPIDTNFFLVGLNDSVEATQSNTALMRRENWIDVPLQYVSGRRALVTIEKGTPGDRIFDEVFEYWAANPLPVGG